MIKLALLISRAGYTDAPLFKKISNHPEIDLTVYYFTNFGVGKDYYEPSFQQSINLNRSFLKDYNHKFLKNFSSKKFIANLGFYFNPSVIKELKDNNYDCAIIFGWNPPTHLLSFLTCFFKKIPVLLHGESPFNQELKKPSWKLWIKKIILGKLIFRLRI